nr:pyridoxal-phosphate dependent enzyme [Denitromonas sp.]
ITTLRDTEAQTELAHYSLRLYQELEQETGQATGFIRCGSIQLAMDADKREEMARGCAMHASLAAGKPVQVEELETLADSLGGGIGLDNRYTFKMVQALVDDVVLVTEEDIAAAIRHAYANEQIIIEGSGSVGIAALLSGRVESTGTTAILVSGANIDMALHRRIICGLET